MRERILSRTGRGERRAPGRSGRRGSSHAHAERGAEPGRAVRPRGGRRWPRRDPDHRLDRTGARRLRRGAAVRQPDRRQHERLARARRQPRWEVRRRAGRRRWNDLRQPRDPRRRAVGTRQSRRAGQCDDRLDQRPLRRPGAAPRRLRRPFPVERRDAQPDVVRERLHTEPRLDRVARGTPRRRRRRQARPARVARRSRCRGPDGVLYRRKPTSVVRNSLALFTCQQEANGFIPEASPIETTCPADDAVGALRRTSLRIR